MEDLLIIIGLLILIIVLIILKYKTFKYKCEICGKETNDLYTIEYFTESGISACKECCKKYNK